MTRSPESKARIEEQKQHLAAIAPRPAKDLPDGIDKRSAAPHFGNRNGARTRHVDRQKQSRPPTDPRKRAARARRSARQDKAAK